MGELDYQMALLLQHRFEQEHRSKKMHEKTDQELARALQEQFAQEVTIESPNSGLVYNNKRRNKENHNESKCLTDPSWELVDPTPDIYILFIAFNKRYFWSKLESVCVSWSKRMTTCAGICSYQGRSGMCSITLSEPLLKLRPRKDLVETLLHEMIHAYLFVTNNNRDRDGHGPEFHKHMFRINKESGTNITVYHDFHDEVRLYKQHWWRCNGPCQHRRPFFGMIRRATNRAPGPNDRWWAEHSNSCAGTFIKVKEPEKKQKVTKEKESDCKKKPKPNLPDIRNFLPVVKKSFEDLTSTSNSNVMGPKDLIGKPTVATKTKKDKLVNPDREEMTDEFLAVRNHWMKKFSSDEGNKSKRPLLNAATPKAKAPKTDAFPPAINYVSCPVCGEDILMPDLNRHLDDCLMSKPPVLVDLTQDTNDQKECPLCESLVVTCAFDLHFQECVLNISSEIEGKSEEKVPCLACGKEIKKGELDSHLDDCMNDIFDRKNDKNRPRSPDSVGSCSDAKYNCPFCLKLFTEFEMKNHIDFCLRQADGDVVNSLTDDLF